MIESTAFHLDCTPIIPDCKYDCDKCIAEMKSVFDKMDGVGKFDLEGEGVVVEHDPEMVSTQQLMDLFKTLPSFYQESFIPTLI